MPSADAERWNTRYRAMAQEPQRPPRSFLVEHAHLLPERGWALDAAMGRGAVAGYLLQRGLNVIGVDISPVAVADASRDWPGLHAIVADLTAFGLRDDSLDLVVNFYYLERSLWPMYRRVIKPGGVLVIETLTQAMCAVRPDVDPAYLLAPGELRDAFADWEILAQCDGWNAADGLSRRATSGLIARRPVR